MSQPRTLAEGTLAKIVDRFGLTERTAPGGGPQMTLRSPISPEPVGSLRLFEGKSGGPVENVVAVSLVVPALRLDSHMVFAFTPANSAVPHFTIDSVGNGEMLAFHLDLIPRADLGANLAYMNATLFPLTETFAEAQTIEGLTPAKLTPRQYALMSPWMLAYRATPAAFAAIAKPVDAYLAHWMALAAEGVAPSALLGIPEDRWAERDARNRAALFNPETDPVWAQVDRLLGTAVSAKIREILKGQG